MAEGKEFILSWDHERGVRTIGWWEPGDPRLHFRVEQEVPASFFDENARLAERNDRHLRRGKSKMMIARIPHLLKQQWLKEIDITDASQAVDNPEVDKLMKRKLNDPDYRKLRTGGGRV